MNKIAVLSMITVVSLSACAYNSKQPKDDVYYKNTQGIAWPEAEQKSVIPKTSTTKKSKAGSGYGVSGPADPQLNWQDPAASARQV